MVYFIHGYYILLPFSYVMLYIDSFVIACLGLVSRIGSATLWRMHCPIGNSAE